MNISRKDFLTRGVLSFGRELLTTMCGTAETATDAAAGEPQGALLLFRDRCLAQRGGCFACIDHCPQEAIAIQAGVGIGVDAAKCDGCGECVGFCPVTPQAIRLQPRPVV